MNSPKPDRTALGALLLLIVVWAYSWIVMKQAMQHAGPFDFAALRYVGGTAVLFLVLALRGQSLKPPPLLATATIGLSQTAAFQALIQWALVAGGAGHVSMLAYTMPFWSIMLAWWLLGERPGARQWVGLSLAALGLLMVMQPWQGVGSLESALLAVTGGAFWALSVVLIKRLLQAHQPSMLSLTAWQMAFGSAALCLIAWWVPERTIEWNGAFIFELAYSSVLASSLAWWLWSIIVQRLPTALASLSSLGVPITAVVMAAIVLHERPSGIELIGIALILAGLFVVSGLTRLIRHHRS